MSFRPPSGALEFLQLRLDEFNHLCAQYHVTDADVAAKGKELFPGKTLRTLTDGERGQLWKALEQPQETLPV